MINNIRALLGTLIALACRIMLCLACVVMAGGLVSIAGAFP